MAEKSPVRQAIEAEVIAAITAAGEPITAARIMQESPTAVDMKDLSKILYSMRQEGLIEFGPEVPQVNQKPRKTYFVAHGVPQKSERDLAAEALRKMYSAEDDDAEACLDSAATSQVGDESAHPVHAISDNAVDHMLRDLSYRIDRQNREEEARIAAALNEEPDWLDEVDPSAIADEVAKFHRSALRSITDIADILFRAPIPDIVRLDVWAQINALRYEIDKLHFECCERE